MLSHMSARFGSTPQPGRPGLARAGHGRRRERRGRQGRGALLPPGLPAAFTRQEIFEDLVLAAAERITARRGAEVDRISFEVAIIPDEASLTKAAGQSQPPPLGAVFSSRPHRPPRVVLFRRPLETVAGGRDELAWLINDVVVELVAEVLMVPPEELDPGYRGGPGPDQD